MQISLNNTILSTSEVSQPSVFHLCGMLLSACSPQGHHLTVITQVTQDMQEISQHTKLMLEIEQVALVSPSQVQVSALACWEATGPVDALFSPCRVTLKWWCVLHTKKPAFQSRQKRVKTLECLRSPATNSALLVEQVIISLKNKSNKIQLD